MTKMGDRAVQALRHIAWAVTPGDADLPIAVAVVLRTVHDDLVAARGAVGDTTEPAAGLYGPNDDRTEAAR